MLYHMLLDVTVIRCVFKQFVPYHTHTILLNQIWEFVQQLLESNCKPFAFWHILFTTGKYFKWMHVKGYILDANFCKLPRFQTFLIPDLNDICLSQNVDEHSFWHRNNMCALTGYSQIMYNMPPRTILISQFWFSTPWSSSTQICCCLDFEWVCMYINIINNHLDTYIPIY